MATSKKKALRHERYYYIMTKEDTFVLFGNGVNSLTTDMGATVEEDHYIVDKNGSSTRTATAKVQTFSGDMIIGDDAQDYLETVVYALGSEAETEWIEVDAFKGADESGKYTARKVTVLVNITNDGSGDAGGALQFEGEIRWQGDPVEGTFDRKTKTFTASESANSNASIGTVDKLGL
jgi:hypothetical protein